MTVSVQNLTLPRPRLRAPQLPPVVQRLAGQLRDYTILRTRFASQWCQRGLGLVQPRTLDAALLDRGLTLVLPGIESESIFTYGMCDGLSDGGVEGCIRVYNWGLPFPGGYLANLTRVDRNRRRARDVMQEIIRYQDQFPGRPVHIVAQSGGAGVAVFAAEHLPPDRQIDGIVLLGGALSPHYNIAPALRRTRKGLLNYFSPKDYFVLNVGTRIFGTTDRRFTPACGCIGFARPEKLTAEDHELYSQKLHQLRWTQEMADTCQNWGGHLSSGGEAFLARYVSPWVRS